MKSTKNKSSKCTIVWFIERGSFTVNQGLTLQQFGIACAVSFINMQILFIAERNYSFSISVAEAKKYRIS